MGLPLLLPRLNHGITAATDTDGPTMVTPITERGPPMLNLPPMLMPSLNHGGTAATDMDGPIMVTLITERGLLTPSQPPTLKLSPNRGGMAATEHMPGPTMVTPTWVKLIEAFTKDHVTGQHNILQIINFEGKTNIS